jgi:GTP-binding protein SAR1
VGIVARLVDAFKRERFTESKKKLHAILSDEELEYVPFLVLRNKVGLGYAAAEE